MENNENLIPEEEEDLSDYMSGASVYQDESGLDD